MVDRQLGHVRMAAVTRRIAARSPAAHTSPVCTAVDRTPLLGHGRPRPHPNYRSTISSAGQSNAFSSGGCPVGVPPCAERTATRSPSSLTLTSVA
jgi:hypothetical protein